MASNVSPKAPIGSLQKVFREKQQKLPLLNKIGKRTKDWLKLRREWLKENPPDWIGNYECALCGIAVPKNEVQLDHIEKRGSHPDQRLNKYNLRPTCGPCNYGRD